MVFVSDLGSTSREGKVEDTSILSCPVSKGFPPSVSVKGTAYHVTLFNLSHHPITPAILTSEGKNRSSHTKTGKKSFPKEYIDRERREKKKRIP